jgi:hypothetical protein
MGRSPNNPADQASNRHLETRSPKVPTRSGHGATAGTVDDDILSSGALPTTSNNEFASKKRGHEPNDNKAAGAATFRTRQVATLAGGGPAASARCSADSVFVLANSGKTMRLQPPRDDRMAM